MYKSQFSKINVNQAKGLISPAGPTMVGAKGKRIFLKTEPSVRTCSLIFIVNRLFKLSKIWVKIL